MGIVGLKTPRDSSAAAWIEAELSQVWGSVGNVVPSSFEAYARVFHPAVAANGELTRWSDVARARSRKMHARAQWHALIGATYPEAVVGASSWTGGWPTRGYLRPEVLDPLCEVLSRYTSSPNECFLAFWTGGMPAGQVDAPQFPLPLNAGRNYVLLKGPLYAAVEVADGRGRPELPPVSPSMLWPSDRAWFLASEIDFDSTLVGGSAKLIKAIIESAELEAWQVEPTDLLTVDADDHNPN